MKIRYIIALLAAASLAAACTKEGIALTYINQDEQIEKYVSAQLARVEGSRAESNAGVTRLVLSEGSGETLQPDGAVSFYYAGYVFTGDIAAANLFATNNESVAAAAGWSGLSGEDRYAPRVVHLSDGTLVEGLRRGLAGVRPGEECIVLFSGKLGYGKKAQGTIPAGSALAYHIWVIDIENK